MRRSKLDWGMENVKQNYTKVPVRSEDMRRISFEWTYAIARERKSMYGDTLLVPY